MDVFSQYEEEFLDLKGALLQRIQLLPSMIGEERRLELAKAQKELQQANDLFDQMDLSASDTRSQNKTKEYKVQLESLTTNLQKASSTVNHDLERASLLGVGTMRDLDVTSSDHRKRFEDTTMRLHASTNYIQSSLVTTEETIGVARDTLEDLNRQRGVIVHARGRLADVNDSLTRGFRTMRGITRRIATNKLIVAVFVIILIATIAIIIYFKWGRHVGGSGGGGDETTAAAADSSAAFLQ